MHAWFSTTLSVSVVEANEILEDFRRDAEMIRSEVARQHAENQRAHEAVDALLTDRVKGFEFLAQAWADY